MSSFDFTRTIETTARNIKHSTRCPEHGTAPEYKIVKTSKGADVSWSFCCDSLGQIVKQKFAIESKKQMEKAVADSLKDIFKKR